MDLPPPLSSLEQVKERDGEEGKMNEGRSRDSSLLSRAVPRRRMEPERGRERETRTGGNAHRGERDPEKERKRKKKVCFCLLPPHLLRFLLFLEGTKPPLLTISPLPFSGVNKAVAPLPSSSFGGYAPPAPFSPSCLRGGRRGRGEVRGGGEKKNPGGLKGRASLGSQIGRRRRRSEIPS